MAQILIRNLSEIIKKKIKNRAKKNGCSMEEEARNLLRIAVDIEQVNSKLTLFDLWQQVPHYEGEFELPPRTGDARYVDFS